MLPGCCWHPGWSSGLAGAGESHWPHFSLPGGQCQLSLALPAFPSPLSLFPYQQLPPSAFPVIAKAPVNPQTFGLECISHGSLVLAQMGFLSRAALRHSSGAASLSIYFPSFRSQGTGLLLSCWLLWKAMCCKYNILLSLGGTVTQFRVWSGGQHPKGGFPLLCPCSGLGVCHTETCPTSGLPQQLSMLCSVHLYWCQFT